MYGLAAPMQIVAALGGTFVGVAQWGAGAGSFWLVGALLLVSVIPYTLLVLKPINDQLLDTKTNRSEAEAERTDYRAG